MAKVYVCCEVNLHTKLVTAIKFQKLEKIFELFTIVVDFLVIPRNSIGDYVKVSKILVSIETELDLAGKHFKNAFILTYMVFV